MHASGHKVAVVSGVSRGIGLATAKRLHAAGFAIIGYARNVSGLKDLFTEGQTPVHFIQADAAQEKDIHRVVAETRSFCGCPEVLINNVAVYEGQNPENETFETLQRLMQINFYAAWQLTQPFLPDLKKRQSGHIVTIGSVVAFHPKANTTAYTISKSALRTYTELLKMELDEHHVKVSGIYPASVNTSSWDGVDAPKNQFIQADELAELIVHIVQATGPANFHEVHVSTQLKDF